MDYIIKFDNREKELIKILETKGYNMILENLDLGDIQFLDLTTKEIIIIIERKTLSDLSSSIKDGRYKEQKERMIHSIKKNTRKIVLIEGTDYENFSLPLTTLNSVIINTLIRDNIHIHLTKDKNETIQFIENIILQLPKYFDDLKKEIVLGEEKIFTSMHNCKTSKKENLTKEICFRNMLAQISGISTTSAQIYVDKYKNMENFIFQLKKECNDDKAKIIETLANEKCNNRRVGEKLAEKIVLFIFDNDEDFIKMLETPKKKVSKKASIKVKNDTVSMFSN